MINYMDSDESYETTSEMFQEVDAGLSLNTSWGSLSKSNQDILDLYLSSASNYDPNQQNEVDNHALLPTTPQEQTLLIRKLKKERVGFLEQIAHLCLEVESKEREIYELVQSYENKVNTIANYMQKVQEILLQLSQSPSNISSAAVTNTNSLFDEDVFNSIKENLTDFQNLWSASEPNGLKLLNKVEQPSSAASKPQLPNFDPLTPTNQPMPSNDNHVDQLRATVCQLPPFCWSSEQVQYWLNEYACLPGMCLQAARGLNLDGKQLTSLSGVKAEKLLKLSDKGLRRKLYLALEDLRVYGSPGLSRNPGPSHINPNWVCTVWLPRYLGLAHLVPAFAARRVDGRMLASLTSPVRDHGKSSTRFRYHSSIISKSKPKFESNGSLIQLPSSPQSCNDYGAPCEAKFKWRGANRREVAQVLLGVGADHPVAAQNTGQSMKRLLGRTEILSLVSGLELLRRFNFNIEVLENAQRNVEGKNENLLLWTNSRVTKWLNEIGLGDFTHGIEGSGLHGAFMVFDQSFDTLRLMKQLNIPATTAAVYRLDDHLQALLTPARQIEGISPKRTNFFSRKHTNRLRSFNLSERKVLSTENLDQLSVNGRPSSTVATPCLSTDSTSHTSIVDEGRARSSRLKILRLNKTWLPKATKSARSDNPDEPNSKATSYRANGHHSVDNRDSSTRPQETPCSRRKYSFRKKPAEQEKISPNSGTLNASRTGNVLRSASNVSGSVKPQATLIEQPHEKTRSINEPDTPKGPCGLRPRDAPVVDPFNEETKRNRTNILLGQKPRTPNRPVVSPIVIRPVTAKSSETEPVNTTSYPSQPSVSTNNGVFGQKS